MILKSVSCVTDGWTTNDVVYQWKIPEPVQFVKNLFLPGGFELENFMDGYCNVKTATGENEQKEKSNPFWSYTFDGIPFPILLTCMLNTPHT